MAVCPYCESIVTIDPSDEKFDNYEVVRETKGRIRIETMYSCPHCGKVLGFAYFRWGLLSGDRP